MLSLLLPLLLGCAEPASWTHASAVDPPEVSPWSPEAIEILEQWPFPQSMQVEDGELLMATGLGVQFGDRSVITPGWTFDIEVDGDALIVADGPAGLAILDRSTLQERERLSVGTVVSVAGPWVLVAEGALWNRVTDTRIPLDGAALSHLAVAPDGRWWVAAADGAVFEGRDDALLKRHDIRARKVAIGEKGLYTLNVAQTLTRDSEDLDREVTDLIAPFGGAVWWIRGDAVIREGVVMHQRPGTRALRLGLDGDGVFVSWMDGRIERVGAAVETMLTMPMPPPNPVPSQQPPWSLGREGLIHEDGTIVRLPDNARGDWYTVGPDDWVAGWNRSLGVLTLRGPDGQEVRARVPAQLNQVAWVPGYAILALSRRGVGAIALDGGEWPEIQVVDLAPLSWTSVCGDGRTAWITDGKGGVVHVGIDQGELAILGRLDTPGDAQMCRFIEGHVQIFDLVASVRLK